MQLIITYLIIGLAGIAALVLIIRRLKRKPDKDKICDGCGSECGSCHFYQEMEKAKKQKP